MCFGGFKFAISDVFIFSLTHLSLTPHQIDPCKRRPIKFPHKGKFLVQEMISLSLSLSHVLGSYWFLSWPTIASLKRQSHYTCILERDCKQEKDSPPKHIHSNRISIIKSNVIETIKFNRIRIIPISTCKNSWYLLRFWVPINYDMTW